MTTLSAIYGKQILIFSFDFVVNKEMVNAAAAQAQSCVCTWVGRLLKHTN